jgi:hypothetical protein
MDTLHEDVHAFLCELSKYLSQSQRFQMNAEKNKTHTLCPMQFLRTF